MSQGKMQEEFEAWARKRGMDLEYRNIPGLGQFYECPRTLLAQEAWQASRAAVVVDLNACGNDDDHSGGASLDFTKVCDAIEAAGLRVAP